MRSLSPLELIGAHRWKRATFTSYALSATFVEAVIVERLMRGGATEITILVDPLGYRMALRERGAVRIGREYVVHPVAVSNGCFHPKIMVLEADDAVHATVGSGNLTFGGWSANLECIEHLHDGGSALALGDLGGFFGALADSRGCEHDAREACRSLGNRLAAAAARGSDDGRLRVSHSLERPIVDAVAQAAASMGRVERVTLASPYWDATAVDAIGERFGVQSCGAHVPVARVPAPTGMDWPRAARRAMPVRIEALTQGEGVSRPLHAKMLEVACAGGRVTVAGSANATTAGLMSGGPTMRNVEVSAIRAVQGRSVRWKLGKAAAPPKPSAVLEEDADGDADVAVLVAEHDAGGISGRVITSWRSRSASASVEAGGRSFTLGTIEIGKDGDFTILPERLDAELSLEGRVQLRLDAQNETAEGFVASPGFGTIRARAGSALASMLAVIRDMQTPEDVAAIMEWVRANPRALGAPMQFRSGGVRSGDRDDPLVDAARVPETSRRGQQDGGGAGQGEGGRADHDWQQFVGRLLGATARARPREEEQADDEEPAEARRRLRARSAAEKLSLRFPAIFQKLEGDVRSDVELVNLLGLTSFVCVTTSHPMAAIFVQRLATIAERLELGPVARDVLAWCLVYLAAGASTLEAATTRARMLLLGIDPSRDPDLELALPALADLVAPAADVPGTFEAIRRIRTVHEDVRALQDALGAGAVPADLDALGFHPRWRAIVGECGREPERRRIHFVEVPRDACPKCNIALLPHLRSELRRVGVCESACHGFILARNPPCPTR